VQPRVAIERGDELPPEAQGLLRMQRIRMLQQRQQAQDVPPRDAPLIFSSSAQHAHRDLISLPSPWSEGGEFD
jgi:hypothetical protein